MSKQTPLHQSHVDAGGKLVDFSGWHLPIHYGSQMSEHQAVREAAGMFDVSHMTIVDVQGNDAAPLLRKLLSNDIDTLNAPGDALYSCMLNDKGGIIDDLIVYLMQPSSYRVVVNAATREKDLAWINQQAAELDVAIDERADLAMIAVQGPSSHHLLDKALSLFDTETSASTSERINGLSRYQSCEINGLFIAATGYTGEDGFEIALAADDAATLWSCLLKSGVQPCGLGARDTLRLEAGMSLYGNDMDETTTPYNSALGWSVAWQPEERAFNGRTALTDEYTNGAQQKLCGFVLDGKGVLRGGQLLYSGDKNIGVITSGTFSPTLKKSIAFGRIDADHSGDCEVQIRQNRLPVRMTRRVFVRNGKAV